MKNWNKTFLETAKLISENSTCQRKKVGAVIVKEKRIISIGINGVAHGVKHCEDHFLEYFREHIWENNSHRKLFPYPSEEHFEDLAAYQKWTTTQEFYDLHGQFSSSKELHAETNAIVYADRERLIDSSLYVTLSPCQTCAKTILASRIKEVYFNELYDRDIEGLKFLQENGIKLFRPHKVISNVFEEYKS